jgi:hypothetical protein
MASGRYVEPATFCVRGRMSEQRVAMRVYDLVALITAERHRDKLEKPDEASPISTIAC